MLRKKILGRELGHHLTQWLGQTLTVGLALGLLLSLGVILLFAKIAEDVVEGESRAFDTAVLLWIDNNSPEWLYGPMLVVTTLGYYWFVVPLLVVATAVFYWKRRRISAVLLPIATLSGMVLTTVLKDVFERARPDLFESGYTASFYSFPSGHATIAVGFYGTLTLLVAWRLRGPTRWAVAAAGTFLVLLIGFSRLYLGVHYPTDILAGFLAAPLWISAIGLSYFLWRAVRGATKIRWDDEE
ncbi:phosphatase PAP2 family protein [Rubrobacter marinus]|uniref:Phosphatase PAP2 family protein n=1 Tax=Rubrobacter marinus TaxID=2653852 RepID=A0A6G8PT72_9ACTN|nr:phosphatase PAP2 family protein [Rubrobacter marinus]QIN77282.1 phosphatase PAP2 family protein [Rubrobacter marinus]